MGFIRRRSDARMVVALLAWISAPSSARKWIEIQLWSFGIKKRPLCWSVSMGVMHIGHVWM